jgi:hypothetical protein
VSDFAELLGGDLDSLYLVEATWENYERFAPRLNERLAGWHRSNTP